MSGPVTAPVLDHLALASRRAWDNLERYGRQLGGRWLGGPIPEEGEEQAFYFCQVGFANGTKLEFLEPNGTPGSDFLTRFLHRNGPGPHHLTFKVTDIEATMADAESAGYQVVNADLSKPNWKEAFLHPKQSHGIVIQLAQQGDGEGWPDPAPLPPSEQGDGTTVDRVTHLVADLDAAVELFGGVLGMEKASVDTDGPLGPQVEMVSGPWVLRLVAPTAPGPRQWLGDRSGRVLQLEMTVADPSVIDDVRREGSFWYLGPEHNLGARILITTGAGTGEG